MSRPSQQLFRDAAIERLSSPDQIDHLVGITRPADWLAALVISLVIAALVAWSVLGRVPTRVAGQGMLIGQGGKLVDAVSAAAGSLGSIDVAVGDQVKRSQVIAHLSQRNLEDRYRSAVAVLSEREREQRELDAAMDQNLAAKDKSFAAQKAGLEQAIATAETRAASVASTIDTLNGMLKGGLTTQPDIEQQRVELYAARQRATDSRNAILALEAQKLDLESQRAHDRLNEQFRVDDARREAQQLADLLDRDSRILSPSDGRVTEIKVSPGAVLAVGTPIASVETTQQTLEAVVYLPADQGKDVNPGMAARIEPATVKREEYGELLGRVASISKFPVSPEGLAAVLHNADLVKRFTEQGPIYETIIDLTPEAASPSGYRWSSGTGPALRLTSGTLARAQIITRERPPIELVLPLFRRTSGIGD